MRTRRIAFWIILAVSLFSGLYTGLRVFYIVFFSQVLLLILGVSLAYYTIKNFRFTQILEATHAVKGSRIKLDVKIANETAVPLSMMDISVRLAAPGRKQKISLCIAPFSEKEFEVELDLPYRGIYEVGMDEIRITDIFGITCIKYDIRMLSYYRMSTLTVVPRSPAASSADEILDEKFFGDALSSLSSSGDSIAGARKYSEGDALKRVNWKLSARYGELFVKQYDIPARENVVILLDLAEKNIGDIKSAFFKREKAIDYSAEEEAAAKSDTICECAAAVARMSLLRGKVSVLYGLNSGQNDDKITVSSDADTENMLLWLAAEDYERKGSALEAAERFSGEFTGASLIVITSDERSDLAAKLEKYTSSFDSIGIIAVGFAPQKSGRTGALSVPVGADVSALFTKEVR